MSSHDPSAPFNAIVGATLVAVTFVWDYVQLQFEAVELAGAAQLTAHTLPTVELAARCWTSGDDGWRDALCARIGAIVRKAWCSNQRLQLDFEDGATFTVSLRDEDYVRPEAFTLSVPGQPLVVQ